MSETVAKAAHLMEMLPESDQSFAFEFIKKLVLAWDPDYTKLTANEEERVKKAQSEMEAGEYVSDDSIDWATIGNA